MCPNNRQQVVLLQEGTCCIVREEVGTTSHIVVCEELIALLIAKVLKGIGPEQVTHDSMSGRLPKAVDLGENSV